MTIQSIQLVQSRFDWRVTPADQGKLEGMAEAERQLKSTTEIQTGFEPAIAPSHVLLLKAIVRGFLGDVPVWEIEATYRGEFSCASDGDITPESLRQVHGPAWLYSYAREFVSDLARRANLGGVMLPAVNFQVNPPAPGG
ncbi:MAG: protein-export chaperone SecB [Planctomycetota bacterium]